MVRNCHGTWNSQSDCLISVYLPKKLCMTSAPGNDCLDLAYFWFAKALLIVRLICKLQSAHTCFVKGNISVRLVFSLTELDYNEQETVLIFLCCYVTECKPVTLEIRKDSEKVKTINRSTSNLLLSWLSRYSLVIKPR